MKFRVRTYDREGNSLHVFTTENFHFALKLYVTETKINPVKRPTLWVSSGDAYVRVHDYNFDEVTDGNIQKYLQERIIDSDDLLGDIRWP